MVSLLVFSQAAQVHYVWVRASEVIWSEYTRIISVLCQINAKSLKDMKSSCLSICTSSIKDNESVQYSMERKSTKWRLNWL